MAHLAAAAASAWDDGPHETVDSADAVSTCSAHVSEAD